MSGNPYVPDSRYDNPIGGQQPKGYDSIEWIDRGMPLWPGILVLLFGIGILLVGFVLGVIVGAVQ